MSEAPVAAAGDRRGVLTGVQGGRGIAAILVVLYHASISIFALPKYGGDKPFGAVFDFGSVGVDFFFVLSGFIILHAHRKDLGRPERLASYAWKRVRRIYPIYWIVLLPAMIAYFVVPSFGNGSERGWLVILSSILLVHLGTNAAILTVSWTLFHETLFYTIFAVMIWRRRVGAILLTGWLAVAAATLMFNVPGETTQSYISPLPLLFGMGMLVSVMLGRGPAPAPAWLAGGGVALFAGAGLQVDYGAPAPVLTILLFGAASAAILAGIVELERSSRLRTPAWLVLAGEASYAIYLVHLPVLAAGAKLTLPLLHRLHAPPAMSYILLVGIAVLAGIVSHLCIEKPLLRRLEFRWKGGRTIQPPGRP